MPKGSEKRGARIKRELQGKCMNPVCGHKGNTRTFGLPCQCPCCGNRDVSFSYV